MGFFLNCGGCTLFPDNNKFGFLELIHVVPVFILTLQFIYTVLYTFMDLDIPHELTFGGSS